MSDIAKKTLPQQGGKAASRAGRTAEEASEAPRSAATPSLAKDEAGSDQESDGGNYTHTKEGGLDDVPEETSIHMTDKEGQSDLQQVEPEEDRSSLTEKAKAAFDAASENQPSDEAREQYLKTAGASTTQPSQQQATPGEGQTEGLDETESLAPEDSITSVGEKASEVKSEAGKVPSEAQAPSEPPSAPGGEDAGEAPSEGDKAPTEVTETDKATEVPEQAEEAAEDVPEQAEEALEGAPEEAQEAAEGVPEQAQEGVEGVAEQAQEGAEGVQEQGHDAVEGAQEGVDAPTEGYPATEGVPETEAEGTVQDEDVLLDVSELKSGTVNKGGLIISPDGKPVGRLTEGRLEHCIGKKSDDKGAIWDDAGKQVGTAIPITEREQADFLRDPEPFESFEGNVIDKEGWVIHDDQVVGKIVDGDLSILRGKTVLADGAVVDKKGSVIGWAERWEEPEAEEEEEEEPEDLSSLKGGVVTRRGFITVEDKLKGKVVAGTLEQLVGKTVGDEQGQIFNASGEVIGRVTLMSEDEIKDLTKEAEPFEAFPDAIIKNGEVIYQGERVGTLVEGDAKKLEGHSIEPDGSVTDSVGRTLGRCERWTPEEPEEEKPEDLSALKGAVITKSGYAVHGSNTPVGILEEGKLESCIGKRADENGQLFSQGKVIGKVRLLKDDELDELSQDDKPFSAFEDATVNKDGFVESGGEIVGKLIEGSAKELRGKPVDADGTISNRLGVTIGKAERWEEPEPEAEAEVDRSSLKNGIVTKAGYVLVSDSPVGKLVSGSLSDCVGKRVNESGEIYDQGKVVGRAETLSDGEFEALSKKSAPFASFTDAKINKDGHLISAQGEIVGKLQDGEASAVRGMSPDAYGEISDDVGRVLGHVIRWEPEAEPEKEKGPYSGLKVNKDGEVRRDGDVVAKLVQGDPSVCAGATVDDDNDVINAKGTVVGHVVAIGDVPEPEESAEDKEKRENTEKDRKLALQMTAAIEECLQQLRPLCKEISQDIDTELAKSEDDRDQDGLVDRVSPKIEKAGRLLSHCEGAIRGLDPSGELKASCQARAASHEATPEEVKLSETLKDLTLNINETIEESKRKLQSLPKAKEKINPLWALLSQPLGQIVAGVGMLLAGVLGLLSNILNGLGLGKILGSLLGGLGLTDLLDGLGLKLGKSSKKDGKKSGGGLLGGLLG